jgi:hypothetical protein
MMVDDIFVNYRRKLTRVTGNYARATHSESISRSTDLWSNLTDRTSRTGRLALNTIPSIPASGPPVIRPFWPVCQYGYGIIKTPASLAL